MIVLPDADIDMAADAAVSAGYGSAGERCMAIATIVAVGDVADPLVEAIKERLPKIKVGPGSDPTAEMGPLVTKVSTATRWRRTSTADRRRARRSSPTAASTRSTTARTGSSWASRSSTTSRPAMDCLPRRDLRPGADGHAGQDVRGGGQARQRQPVRQRHGDLHPRRRSGPPVPVRGERRAWSASTCRSRCRSRTTASAAGRPRSSATCTCTAPRAIQFYTRAKIVTSRWPDPGTSKIDLGFPRTR